MNARDLEKVLTACALRFDGYAYDEWRRKSDPKWKGLPWLYDRIRQSGKLRGDDSENFATFFGLQRFLCKWGGEQLGWDSIERRIYARLFLHLYQKECPETFRDEHYCNNWPQFTPDGDQAAETLLAKLSS